MRTLKAGLMVALVGSMLVPLAAAARQDGLIAGSAAAEVKEPYSQYVVRARDVNANTIASVTTLDSEAKFALTGLTPGTFLVELVKGAAPNGQGGKVICTAGPYTLTEQSQQMNDLMIERGANIRCNRPVAAWWLLGAAAAAGITAGIVAGGDPASGAQ